MHQVKKGNQWYFGMKAHIGVDAVHGLGAQRRDDGGQRGSDITQVPLAHSDGAETQVWGDAGYAGVARRPEHRDRAIDWQVALRPGQRRRLAPGSAAAQAEQRKASIRAKVEHPFLYVKRHFGYAQVRYRGLAKNRTRLCLLLGFTNLLLAARAALGVSGRFAPRAGALAARTAAHEASQPPNAVNPTPHDTLPLPWRSGTLVIQSFLRPRRDCRPIRAAGVVAGQHAPRVRPS